MIELDALRPKMSWIRKFSDWLYAVTMKHPVVTYFVLVVLTSVIFICYGKNISSIIAFFGDWPINSQDANAYKGLFGDSFGALTSFFSILTLMAMVLTFLCQKHQLDLQR